MFLFFLFAWMRVLGRSGIGVLFIQILRLRVLLLGTGTDGIIGWMGWCGMYGMVCMNRIVCYRYIYT